MLLQMSLNISLPFFFYKFITNNNLKIFIRLIFIIFIKKLFMNYIYIYIYIYKLCV